jgi:hypothetical protein
MLPRRSLRTGSASVPIPVSPSGYGASSRPESVTATPVFAALVHTREFVEEGCCNVSCVRGSAEAPNLKESLPSGIERGRPVWLAVSIALPR